jgi:hypothetical protein
MIKIRNYLNKALCMKHIITNLEQLKLLKLDASLKVLDLVVESQMGHGGV